MSAAWLLLLLLLLLPPARLWGRVGRCRCGWPGLLGGAWGVSDSGGFGGQGQLQGS